MIPDRAANAEQWDFDKLVVILLRQFKRLMAERGLDLTDAELQQVGQLAADYALDDPRIPQITAVLNQIVQESIDLLAGWDLSFAQSLRTDMTDLKWETTADFLEIANEKVNAEIRISAGSALMVALGDYQNAKHLMEAIDYDLSTEGRLDVDAVIAKRALLHAARIELTEPDWLAKGRSWVQQNVG